MYFPNTLKSHTTVRNDTVYMTEVGKRYAVFIVTSKGMMHQVPVIPDRKTADLAFDAIYQAIR